MKAQWLKPNIYWLVFVAVALLGVALVQGLAIKEFKFDKNINIVDVAAALLTLFLAFYVPRSVEKAISTQRYEKEALIAEIRQVITYFDTALSTSQLASSPVSAGEEAIILGAVENSAKALQMLEDLFKESKFDDPKNRMQSIRSQRLIFKKLATGGNFGRDDFSYLPYNLSLMSTAYHSMKQECVKLIFDINRS